MGFSPDGKRVVSGSDDSTIRLWDVGGVPLREHWHKVAYAADGEEGAPGLVDHATHISCPSGIRRCEGLFLSRNVHGLGTHDTCPVSWASISTGWVVDDTGRPLFWVLPECRRGLWSSGTMDIWGATPVLICFQNFKSGEFWASCQQPLTSGSHT
jgi:hypothetical protein